MLKLKKLIGFAILLLIAILIVRHYTQRNVKKVVVSQEMVLKQVEQLGKLEVVKYTIRDVVEYEKERQYLPNSKTALIVTGEVIGCVDLSKMQKDDFYSAGDSVRLLLPAPEVASFKIDHAHSKVYSVEYGFWETTDLVDEAYTYAEKQLYLKAQQMGLEKDGRENTIKILSPMLRLLGFKKINIMFKLSTEQFDAKG